MVFRGLHDADPFDPLSCYCKTDIGPNLLTLSRFVFYYS